MAEVGELLKQLVEMRGSDLHLKAGSPPFIRINGRLQAVDGERLRPDATVELSRSIIPADRMEEFAASGEADFALSVPGLGRFRVSVLRQRGSIAIVMRRVLNVPPTLATLGLPPLVGQLAEKRQGLILVTGPADSGRSTTIASMLNHINENSPVSIITIEDPIEILHADQKAFVQQREIGSDTKDHLSGLRHSLRHDSDVVYIDRVPDVETMDVVLAAATSRLIITSFSSLNCKDTLSRIVDMFPERQAAQTRGRLAAVLQGIISQRLLDREDGKGRVAAFELMSATPRIVDAIVEAPGSQELDSLIKTGDYYGMQTLDQHLVALHQKGLVGLRDVLSSATHPQEVRVVLQQSDPS